MMRTVAIPNRRERSEAIIRAAQGVGRPLFLLLLVITVSFVPVLSLEAEEGCLAEKRNSISGACLPTSSRRQLSAEVAAAALSTSRSMTTGAI